MFTTAAVATNVCALPVGAVLDRYGPRVSGVTGSALIAIGAVLLAFGALLPFDCYLPGYTLLALGGPFVFISSFQLSNAFPNHSGLILALLTGAFDSSSAVFLFYRLLYNASERAFTPERFFLAYLIVPVTMLLVQLFIMPSKSYEIVGELTAHAENPLYDTGNSERTEGSASRNPEMASLLGHTADDEKAKKEEKKRAISGVWGVMHGRSALQQIKSSWFILITMFTVVQMTRINYFVATIRTQYDYLLDSKVFAEHVNNVFDIALPLGGVVSVPFIGLILDNTSTPFVLGLLVVIGTAIGVLGVLPLMWAAYLNVGIFVLYRPFYYTAVSDYTAKVFGFHTFGKVYGLIICLAGFLNFSQSALDAMTHKVFHRNPVPVNMFMLGIALTVGLALAGFVWYKSRSMARNYLEMEAEDATETMMPAAIEGGI
jgi:MFS family permease